MMNATASILMVRPAAFHYNQETAINNKFQRPGDKENAQLRALEQFDKFVALLKTNGLDVNVFEDTPQPVTPDAIFPNNWISFHPDGTAILYPMFAQNRRNERRMDILEKLAVKYQLDHIVDLSHYEKKNQFLEGTGSMVLDHSRKKAYMCTSQRSDQAPFDEFCKITGYRPVLFEAVDSLGYPIYHTNVMMCIASSFVVICTDAIRDASARLAIEDSFHQAKKEIIRISFEQMAHFAGNMLELSNKFNERLLVMSKQAFLSLNKEQRTCLEEHTKLLYAPLDVIESNGGGSARCMIAEIFLPPKKPAH